MKRYLLFLMPILVLVACKSETKKVAVESIRDAVASKTLQSPAAANSQLPRLFSNGNELYFSWVERKDSLDILNYAVWKDDQWSNVSEVIKGKDWFTNWADFPSIAENNGNILTSFLQKSADGTYTYDVKLNLYNAKTQTWKKNFILHDDGTQSEHGFVTIRPYAGDSFLVTWLDGRETVGKGHGGGQMTLRAALVFEDGTIDYDTLLDEKVCDCCQTTAAIGPDDEILVAYRDRSEDEIRDISLVRWDKKSNWSEPKSIGNDQWKIAGCPVNGPSMDAIENSVGLAWFTGVDDEGKVNVSFSDDAGVSFGNVTRIDAGDATGRVDITWINESEAAVIWMEPKGEEELIQLVVVSKTGAVGLPITIATTSAERSSGFPQLERVGQTLYVAYTLVSNERPKIKLVTIDSNKI